MAQEFRHTRQHHKNYNMRQLEKARYQELSLRRDLMGKPTEMKRDEQESIMGVPHMSTEKNPFDMA